ncbi:MAG: insulinase family protein [Actinomycetota bacterium]
MRTSWATAAVFVLFALVAAACASSADVTGDIAGADGSGAPTTESANSPSDGAAGVDGADGVDTDSSADDGNESGDSRGAETTTPSPSPPPSESDDSAQPPLEPIDSTFTAPADWPVGPFAVEAQERVLDNGLRILVQPNDSPGGQAQFRLVVNAGSVHEEPDSLGSAHFLEHMLFNGTERWPGNGLIPILESFGSAFGPDVNAYTSFDETVYKLTVPSRDGSNLDLAVDVLFEWAQAATITPDAVDAERGVVREEYRRSQETLGGRLSQARNDVLFGDTNRYRRHPLGTLDSIDAMEVGELRAFYERWYRPDNMTVIAVGDFDVDAMFARIASSFTDWSVASPVPDQPRQAEIEAFGDPIYEVIDDPELTRQAVNVAWRVPVSPVVDRRTLRERQVRQVAMSVLEGRLFERTERSDASWQSASAGLRTITPSLLAVNLRGVVDPGGAETSMAELLLVAEQLRQHDVDAAELTRALDRVRAGAEQALAARDTRQDRTIADELVGYALDRGHLPEPEETLAATIDIAETITATDVRAFFDQALRSNPYVAVTTPTDQLDQAPAPAVLEQLYQETVGGRVDALGRTQSQRTVLMERPALVQTDFAIERIDELGAVVATFDNGVRMAFRESDIVSGQVEFQAWSRGGFFAESPELAPLLGRTSGMVMPSGFASIDAVELDQLLSGSVVFLEGDIGRAQETLAGDASVDDLETLFQLIHLQMTESTISEAQARQFEDGWRPLAESPEAFPELMADLELWRLRYGDSPYFRLVPTVEDLNDLDVDAQLQAWDRRYANAGDFIFVFVGDVAEEDVLLLGLHYLATLPSTGERDQAIDRDPGLPEENLVSTVSVGVGDQGRLRMNWESPYPFTIEAEVAAEVAELVVDARLRDLVREQLGASYSPRASVSVLSEPKSWVDTIIELNGDPDRLVEISGVIHDELARMRAGDIEPQYLELAVDQLVEDWRFFSNPFWIDRLTFHLANPQRDPGEYRRRSDLARSLTLDDLAESVQIIFPETRSVEVRMVPAE